ncbi:M14 metallopeptidase family protein [Lewinella sp. JB7]|uniref:M14 metallopeptidase family protein n=1 Tax=Lewinella sp. JB7 TaxID=2962887 RepID=UPI0020CA228B|nr:M14 metallopeptidase family protein [Lewinella sp. JB7]MCP9235735.1 M14 family metallopeptidase [Lewinella sp. JB7]
MPRTTHQLLLLLCLLVGTRVPAQTVNSEADRPLTYYLPDLNYDPAIPTPEEFLGWQIGDWHISHDLQQAYMRLLAASSDRITLVEIGKSYEQRPLLNLIFTSPENRNKLEDMRALHLNWNKQDGGLSENDIDRVPAVLYQGFSIHGNEPSGANAAPLVAYYLAAAPMSEVGKVLENNIVVFDPSYNPDGLNRFASWVNSHKNKTLTADPADREYNEAYPRGRSNHYWFDLNRDWLPVQHPESRARIAAFHRWMPNVLTDHHEMGKDATFFFMPGAPTRVHPSTPQINQDLTAKIGTYHAAALDKIGSLYYSGEGYDDFYYGKGSTYPDVHGAVGILFEQASSRGHLQDTENGELSFPFTVRNQVTTALSTLEAFAALRNDLLTYQRNFTIGGVSPDGYLIEADNDPGRARELANILSRHGLPVQHGGSGDTEAYYVPKTPFSEAAFEPILEFEDSLFYDVSTFSLPMAFNLPFRKVSGGAPGGRNWTRFDREAPRPEVDHASAEYAYLLPANDYYATKAIYQLLDRGVRVKVSDQPFSTGSSANAFGRGTVMVPVIGQSMTAEELHRIVTEVERETGLDFIPAGSGTVDAGGLMFGSRSAYQTLRKPEIALIVEGGTSSLDAGEVWHLLDQRFEIPITKLAMDEVGSTDLSRYNTIVMVDGNYSGLGAKGTEALQRWMGSDRVLITMERAGTWAAENGLAKVKTRKVANPDSSITQRPYAKAYRDYSGKVLGGSIYEARADLTHPLLFGMQREEIPLFRTGTLLYEPAKNVYATPLRYTDEPLLSGYSPREFAQAAAGSAGVIVSGKGGGRTISFASNPNFRGFWYGGNRLFMNAIMFGHTISGSAVE